MITPEDIRVKAARLYPQAVAAWLRNQAYFPRPIPANLQLSPDVTEAARQTQTLRAHSKEALGYGYSVSLESRKSRRYGEQNFAVAITLDSLPDLLKLAGKVSEFGRLARAVELLRSQQPALSIWAESNSNWRRLLAAESSLPQLLNVAEYLQLHPRPGCFIRELPLAISTKLVEENFNLLAQWLDILVPEAIDFAFDRTQFAQRYGFRSVDDQLWLRILDVEMLAELRCPGDELAVPLKTLAELPVRDARVFIVENKINLLTLPALKRTLALGGLGRGVTRLFRVPWIAESPVVYWGDLDVEGLQILADVRAHWPHAESFMMDSATLDDFRSLTIPGNAYPAELSPPAELNVGERSAFIHCRDDALRLEQERIHQSVVNERMLRIA